MTNWISRIFVRHWGTCCFFCFLPWNSENLSTWKGRDTKHYWESNLILFGELLGSDFAFVYRNEHSSDSLQAVLQEPFVSNIDISKEVCLKNKCVCQSYWFKAFNWISCALLSCCSAELMVCSWFSSWTQVSMSFFPPLSPVYRLLSGRNFKQASFTECLWICFDKMSPDCLCTCPTDIIIFLANSYLNYI